MCPPPGRAKVAQTPGRARVKYGVMASAEGDPVFGAANVTPASEFPVINADDWTSKSLAMQYHRYTLR